MTRRSSTMGDCVAGSISRSMLYATAAASQTSPLWNFTFSRRWKRQVLSSLDSQRSARPPASLSPVSLTVSVSKTLISTFMEGRSPCLCGSRVVASEASETRRAFDALP
nr:hypothetical protein [Nonomuraea cypriaca]